MLSNNTAFKTNFACTPPIRNTFLLAVQFLCKCFIVTELQSENTDARGKKTLKWMVLKPVKLQCLARTAVQWKAYVENVVKIISLDLRLKSNCFKTTSSRFFQRRFKNKNRKTSV